MGESMNTGLGAGTGETLVQAADTLVRASQVAREAEVRRSVNGVRFATFGETGVPGPDLDRMLEAVPGVRCQPAKRQYLLFCPASSAGAGCVRGFDSESSR